MVNSPIPKIAAGIADMGGAGLPEAQYMYGRMLVEGRECDLKAARAWFTRAADSGMSDAQVALAEMMLNGRGGPASTAGALELFEKAAAKGHAGAMFAVGALHAGGHGMRGPPTRSTMVPSCCRTRPWACPNDAGSLSQ
jgi:TPR repeat protein